MQKLLWKFIGHGLIANSAFDENIVYSVLDGIRLDISLKGKGISYIYDTLEDAIQAAEDYEHSVKQSTTLSRS